jgi:hypothetical protein
MGNRASDDRRWGLTVGPNTSALAKGSATTSYAKRLRWAIVQEMSWLLTAHSHTMLAEIYNWFSEGSTPPTCKMPRRCSASHAIHPGSADRLASLAGRCITPSLLLAPSYPPAAPTPQKREDESIRPVCLCQL